jgi:hypothetical protein
MLHTRAGTDSLPDLPRVLRLAGAFHRKGEAFQSRIVDIQDCCYSVAELRRLAEQVAPVAGNKQPRRVGATAASSKARGEIYDATERLRPLLDKHGGLVKPATRELIQQIGAEQRGRHNAIVAIAGRLVSLRWADERAIEFLVPVVNEAFGDGDWTQEIVDALQHAHKREQERLSTMRTRVWPA